MNIRSLIVASVGFVALNAIAPRSSSALEYANLLDDVSNASVSVLTRLGYDCNTASAGGIICTKCEADGLKQKCEAFSCDAVTKKCRRKTADLPNVPGLGNDNEAESEDLPSLPSL
ncbi:MAG: hypothetical protein AAFY63_00315 [Cyanobacteria bacterium J06643_13]